MKKDTAPKTKPGNTRNSGRKASSETSSKTSSVIEKKQIQTNDDRTMKIIIGLIFIVLGVFLFVAVEFQAAGQFGNVIGRFMKGTMGFIGVIFPFYLILVGVMMIADKTVKFSTASFVLGFIILLMLCILNSGRFIDPNKIVFNSKDFFEKSVELKGGGLFGMGLGSFIVKYLGKIGLYCIGLGVTILSVFLLLKDTPAKKLVNHMRIRSQERQIKKNELKELRAKEQEEREKERIRIQENQKIINEIKDEQKRKRALTKDKNARERELAKEKGKDTIEDWPGLIPKGYDPLADFDSSKFDKGIPNEKRDRIISVMNEEVETSEGRSFGSSRNKPASKYGLEEKRIVEEGKGLGDYDSRSDALVFNRKEKPAKSVQPEPTIEKTAPVQKAPEAVKTETKIEDKKPEIKSFDEANEETKATSAVNENVVKITNTEARMATLDEKDFIASKKNSRYKKPQIDLLKYISNTRDLTKTNQELKEKAELLERTLQSFNVDARVVNVTQGPAVTRFEVQPSAGVKVNKIVSLADDIALNLKAQSIRIEAPIPGKAAVGIEIQNDSVNMITIREIIDSREFKESKSKISFGVGRDIAGNAIIADLKDMPHLLIAGSTGSGKSVCINSLITSILYKSTPDEVKLVLIDPKVVELGDYNGIPHLLIPVVTDPSKAAAALNWAVAEMLKRYNMFAENHVRDLESYNNKIKESGDPNAETLPQIVIIIDELADLMMAAPSQVEDSICRLAQLARASGMHLIVATQRPSVEIITGDIKTNIPSRIAFATASQFDSRTILDMGGAEKLVGKGDMLYKPLGMGKPIRVQGCYISDEEIHRVIDFVKNQRDADYSDEVMDTINKGNVQGSQNDTDELFGEAVEYVISAGKASTSLIQRRFRIGYNRAANIIDEMEARGIIGPADGSKPRQVFGVAAQPTESYEEEQSQDSLPEMENEDTRPISEDQGEITQTVEVGENEIYESEETVNEDIKSLFDDLDKM